MKYVSTRGLAPAVDSAEALLNGLAPDGGLYVPAEMPEKFFARPPAKTCEEMMERLLEIFFDDLSVGVRDGAVKRLSEKFSEPEITPLKSIGNGTWILELFHGPTCAFKDVALTVLPPLLRGAAKKIGIDKILILAATSGDTGSAAMSGFAEVEGTEVIVFYPQAGTSEIQRRQMVCCAGRNVSACAIEGNFDDAQLGVKSLLADEKLRQDLRAKGVLLSSANSINIGRLFPQICYYLYAWYKLANDGGLTKSGTFDVVVPTGNFGNILAAHFAKRLGAPIRHLISASNENRVVADFIATGTYDRRREFKITNSPSMDILVSSNTERLLYYVLGEDHKRLRDHMDALKAHGVFTLGEAEMKMLRSVYCSGFATIRETEEAIRSLWEAGKYLIDPHTAVGWKVLNDLMKHDNVPTVIAATAAPWKFPTTILKALGKHTTDDDFENLRVLARSFYGTPKQLASLETSPILHSNSCAKDKIAEIVRSSFKV